MLRAFEAVYRGGNQPGVVGPAAGTDGSTLQRFTMTAEDEATVRRVLAGQGFVVVTVTELYPVVDQNRLVFNRDEAAALLGIEPSTFSTKLGTGEIPWNAKISAIEKAVLLRYVRKGYNAPANAMLKELEQTRNAECGTRS